MFWDICSKFCSKSSLFQEILSREKQKPEPSNHYGSRVPVWYARLDSNQRPSESESDALSNCATGAFTKTCPHTSIGSIAEFEVCVKRVFKKFSHKKIVKKIDKIVDLV